MTEDSPPYKVVAARSLRCSDSISVALWFLSLGPRCTFWATENTLTPLRKLKTFCHALLGLVLSRSNILLLWAVPPVMG